MSTLKRHLPNSVTMLVIIAFIGVAIVTPFLPDYETYRAIYETDGGHLAELGRDIGFVLLIQALNPFVQYDQFRWLIIAVLAGLTIFSLQTFQQSSRKRLGLTIVIAFAPFILLKFGAQFREGIALALWLVVLFTADRRQSWVVFIPAALLSTSIHLGTIALWVLLGCGLYLRRWPATAWLIAAFAYAAFTYIVADVSRLEEELFRGLSTDTVNPDLYTMAYWLAYPFIFLLSVLHRDTLIPPRANIGMPLRALGFVLGSAMTGFLLGISVQIGFTGLAFFQKGVIADSMRLAALLLALYCIFLALCGRDKFTAVLTAFLTIDTVRIILAA